MTRITETAYQPMRHIVTNLRLDDREEILAARGPELNWAGFAQEATMVAGNGFGWIAWREDTLEPVATWGAYRINAGTAGCWAFGTPAWPRTVRSVTRHIRRTMIPTLLQNGFHRAECRALEKREDTRLWLTSLGWFAEAVLSEFGVRRENFVLYAWTASHAASTPHTHHFKDNRQGELPLRYAPRRPEAAHGAVSPVLR